MQKNWTILVSKVVLLLLPSQMFMRMGSTLLLLSPTPLFICYSSQYSGPNPQLHSGATVFVPPISSLVPPAIKEQI